MKQQLIVSIAVSLAFAATAVSVQAESGSNKSKTAQAMQVKIDKKTGRKITPDDMEFESRTIDLEIPEYLDATGSIPLKSVDLGTRSDGVSSALVGSEHHQYLTLTIDENGQKIVEHKSAAEIEAGETKASSDQEVR